MKFIILLLIGFHFAQAQGLQKLQVEKPLEWSPRGAVELPSQLTEQLKRSRVYSVEAKGRGGVDLGGGVTVEINKRPALRDLVDNTTCEWMQGSLFQTKFVPGAQNTIEKIKTSHWYLGDAYAREAADSLVCLTAGPLKKIPDQDLDAVTVFSLETKQVAIRAGRMIFLDMTIFTKMVNQQHRDFLWIHELTHSFIPFDPEDVNRRNESLRSFVRSLSNEFDENRLAVNIEANQLNVPPTTAELDFYKDEILTVYNPRVPISKRAQLATALGRSISTKLWPTDRRRLKEIVNHYAEVSDQIWRAIAQEDFRLIQHLYRTNGMQTSDPLFVAYANQCYYYPTGLQIALHKCGSQPPALRYQPKVVSYFLNEMNHEPSREEIRFFTTKTLRLTPKFFMWVVLFEKNPQYEIAARTAQEIATRVPREKLNLYLSDEVIKSSDLMVESLSKYGGKL